MTRLLALTGGSGFIGKRFAQVARARGYRIRQLARSPVGFDTEDEVGAFDLKDAVDPAILRDCTALVHLAAYIPRDHNDPAEAERCWTVNAMGSLRLFEAAAEVGVRHIVQTTSANAYAPSTTSPDENAPLFPASRGYYLGSKILQEIYGTEFCRTKGIPIASLRLGSVYGPGQTSGAIGAIIRDAVQKRLIHVTNGGLFGGDMVYIDDVTSALMLAIECGCNGPLNVGSGVRTTIGVLAQMIAERTAAEIVGEPASTGSADVGFPALNIGRLLALGHQPTPLAVGIDAMIDTQDDGIRRFR